MCALFAHTSLVGNAFKKDAVQRVGSIETIFAACLPGYTVCDAAASDLTAELAGRTIGPEFRPATVRHLGPFALGRKWRRKEYCTCELSTLR